MLGWLAGSRSPAGIPVLTGLEHLSRAPDNLSQPWRKFNAGGDRIDLVAISREYAGLKPVVATIEAWRRLRAEADEAERMVSDPEMRGLAEEELARIGTELPAAEQAVRLALLPKDASAALRRDGLDPVAAERVEASNTRRIVRALEVIEITGRPFSASLPRYEDIAPIVEFLADPGAWITGQTIFANGGYTTR